MKKLTFPKTGAAIFYLDTLFESPGDGTSEINEFEIHGCTEVKSGNGKTYIEQCEFDDPELDFVGVYVHFKGGGIANIADCRTKKDAEKLVRQLKKLIKNYKP